jgi:hypothetical protein
MRQEVCGGLRAYIANNTQVGFKLTPAYLAAVEIREPLNLCWRRREQPSNLNSIDFIIPSNVLRVLKVSSGSSSSITQPPPTRSLSLSSSPSNPLPKINSQAGSSRKLVCDLCAPDVCIHDERRLSLLALYAQLAADNEKLSCEIGSNLHEFNRELCGKLLADNIFAFRMSYFKQILGDSSVTSAIR